MATKMTDQELAKQISNFMKNYRATQDQAKTLEGIKNGMSELLQGIETRGAEAKAAKEAQAAKAETKTQNTAQPSITANDTLDLSSGMSNILGGFDAGPDSVKNQVLLQKIREAYGKQLAGEITKAGQNALALNQSIKDYAAAKAADEAAANLAESAESDIVEYTYKPGDTFGQVIKNLGLQTDKGLWGPDGDVAWYSEQLYDQGAVNSRGNIPIGTTIRLRRRGAAPAPAKPAMSNLDKFTEALRRAGINGRKI